LLVAASSFYSYLTEATFFMSQCTLVCWFDHNIPIKLRWCGGSKKKKVTLVLLSKSHATSSRHIVRLQAAQTSIEYFYVACPVILHRLARGWWSAPCRPDGAPSEQVGWGAENILHPGSQIARLYIYIYIYICRHKRNPPHQWPPHDLIQDQRTFRRWLDFRRRPRCRHRSSPSPP
jgi:hypothetical protein